MPAARRAPGGGGCIISVLTQWGATLVINLKGGARAG